jgi:integrase
MPLAKAREMHALAMQELEKGIDPGATAKNLKAQRKAEPTFKDLLDEFWEMELSKSPTAKERKRLVEKDALPSWASRKVSSIKRRDAVVLLDDVRERAPITANRLQGVLIRMFNFASERGMVDFSPLAGMRRGKESSRARVLTDAEIKALWNCLDLERTDIDIYRLTKLALKAILLTGQRPGEVAGMTWKEIDGDWWIIPAERSKTHEENRVPLTSMLAEIIELARPYSTASRFVFVSPQSPLYQHKKPNIAKPKESDIPISVGTMANAIRRHSIEMKIDERFTPHDLRRTLRTRLAELGVSDMVAERILGHRLQGVLAIYNRHSYDIEKQQALALWEQRLREILGLTETNSNVIPLEVHHG